MFSTANARQLLFLSFSMIRNIPGQVFVYFARIPTTDFEVSCRSTCLDLESRKPKGGGNLACFVAVVRCSGRPICAAPTAAFVLHAFSVVMGS
jgi:hypothetical protein